MERTPQNLKIILSSLQAPLRHEYIKKICMDICSALVYLHEVHQIVHGDISSANVLCGNLTVDNIYKLSDVYQTKLFGLCGINSNPARAYAAPELNQFPQNRTKQTDIYAFGVLCTEIALHSFPEPSLQEFNAKKITWPHLQALILQCLSISPSNRPTISEMLTGLSLL